MRFHDQRFCRNYRFLFVMVNLKNVERAYKGISALFPTTYSPSNNDVEHAMTNKDLNEICDEQMRAKVHVERCLRTHSILMKNLRGTIGYWEAQKHKLFDMLTYAGPCQFFMSFSAADLYWSDIIVAMTLGDDGHPKYTLEQAQQIPIHDREKILNQNQCFASFWFMRRFKLFMKMFLLNPMILGAKVKDYVVRYETQYRGSVHAHVLLWVDYTDSKCGTIEPDLNGKEFVTMEDCFEQVDEMNATHPVTPEQRDVMAKSLHYINKNMRSFSTEFKLKDFLYMKSREELEQEYSGKLQTSKIKYC